MQAVNTMSRTTPFRTASSLLFAGLFALALFPGLSIAGTREAPEIDDGVGDVPVAVKIDGAPAFAGLFDIDKAFVAAEDQDGVTFRLFVHDIPDSWVLDEGRPTGQPVVPLAGSVALQSDDALFREGIQLTLHFAIAGKDYSVLASLAAVEVQNPNVTPKVDTRDASKAAVDQADAAIAAAKKAAEALPAFNGKQSMDAQFADARLKLAEAYAIADTGCKAFTQDQQGNPQTTCAVDELKQRLCPNPSSSSEGGSELRIGGAQTVGFQCPATGEAAGLVCILLPTANAPLARPCAGWSNLRSLAYEALDVASAQLVLAQVTADSLATGTPLGSPVDAKAPVEDGISKARAQIDLARATLETSLWFAVGSGPLPSPPASPGPSDATQAQRPQVILYHRFQLEDGADTAVTGLIDAKENFLQMRVAKDALSSPAKGALLTHFRADSSFRGAHMDYAPDLDVTQADPTVLAADPSGPFGTYTFGKDYAFAYVAPAVPLPGQLTWKALDGATQAIEAGGIAVFHVSLMNPGGEAVAGVLTLSPDGQGWHAEADQSMFHLAPGAAQTVTVRVTALAGAASTHTTQLDANVDGGQRHTTSFTTSMKSGAHAPSPVPAPHGGSKEILGMPQSAAMVGGALLGALAVVGLAAAGIYVARRR